MARHDFAGFDARRCSTARRAWSAPRDTLLLHAIWRRKRRLYRHFALPRRHSYRRLSRGELDVDSTRPAAACVNMHDVAACDADYHVALVPRMHLDEEASFLISSALAKVDASRFTRRNCRFLA